jgi:MoxR-like ATPase
MISVFLMGGPGVGKTSIVSQAAREVRKQVLTIALPTCEAVDLRGLPYNDNGRTRWASPLPRGGQGVLLLDELSSAAPDVQVAAHHLVWPEEGSDMSLPAGWHIVLTGNRSTDKTLFRAASGPLRNRLTIIPVEASLEHWVKWAMEHNINPAIIGFLRWRPELLTSKEIPNDGAFTSPRAWVSASEVLSFSVHANVERELLLGTVGEGATTEFTAYLRLVRELPAIQAIMDKPDKAAVPTSPSLLYALTSSLAQYTREKKESAMPYVKRMPAEFALLYVRDIRDYFDITTDQDVREWISKHKSLFKDDKS